MATKKKSLLAAAGNAGEALAIEDVFSTYLYTGNFSTQTITNGIDLAGEGGMVWLKARSLAQGHTVTDTERGSNFVLQPNTTDAQVNTGSLYVSSFNSDGFSIGTGSNTPSQTFASWTFRKAPRFFDVVTYTGTGSARTVSHNLGVAPGCIIAKNVSRSEGWRVYHRSQGATKYAMLQSTNAFAAASTVWNNTEPTDSVFTTGSDTGTNGAGDTIVAYLFAHDPLGPSGDGSDGLIACGSYTGDGTTNGTKEINLGWEPQTLIIKRTNAADDWIMTDVMMGIPTSPYGTYDRHILKPNTSDAEYASADYFNVTSTGFRLTSNNSQVNASGSTYIYIAIRRGPMRQPTSGTEVFSPITSSASTGTKLTTGFPVDLQFYKYRLGTSSNLFVDRLRGVSTTTTERGSILYSDSTSAETSSTGSASRFWDNTGFQFPSIFNGLSSVFYNFRRAPGFFDVVAYTGDGTSSNTISHNLGVAPEMIIIKRRSAAANWYVDHSGLGATNYILLNSTAAQTTPKITGNYTENAFDLLNTSALINGASDTYIAYLFATLPGVSKVGSYTGNGISQTIDCGFTSGARFILIKRTDSTGDWYIWDTERGIVAANDPHLSLNSSAAEVTTDDSIDPDNSGFIVNQVSATNINVNAASYIYYAVS